MTTGVPRRFRRIAGIDVNDVEAIGIEDSCLRGPADVEPPEPSTPVRVHRRRATVTGAVGWIRIIAATAARMLLTVLASLLVWAALPAFLGWVPTTVMTDSMAPIIRSGDVVVAMPVGDPDLMIGQILLVNDPDHADRLRLHRLADVNEQGDLILRGDANDSNDSSPVERADVRGVGFLRVPLIGLPVVWVNAGNIAALLALAAALAGLFVVARLDRRYLVDAGSEDRDSRGDSDIRPPHTPEAKTRRPITRARRRARVTVVWAILAVGVLLSTIAASIVPAYAALGSTAPNPSSSLAAGPAYPCLNPAVSDTPFLLYRFTDATGSTAADSSGNARSGTLQSTAASGRVAGSCALNASPALLLDGSAGYVTTPTSVVNPTVFSIEIWFKTTTTAGGKLIGFGDAQTGVSTTFDRHLYMADSGKLLFGTRQGGTRTTIVSPLSYNDGVWHHAVATLNTGGATAGLRLYVDGTLVVSNAAVTTSQNYTGFWRMGFDTMVGWTTPPTSRFFGGTIDSAAVYTAALTPAQVTAHYTGGR